MATGYYNRIYDTIVSGSELLSTLSSTDLRTLQVEAMLATPPVVTVNGVTTLTPQQLVQAAVSSLSVNAGIAGTLSLGADTNANAGSYISLFNLQSTNDVRILRMHVYNSVADANLGNSGGTDLAVHVALDAVNNAGGKELLFDVSEVPGVAVAGKSGCERIILVSASNLGSGTQQVQFNITSISA